jgi:hypothetical protein
MNIAQRIEIRARREQSGQQLRAGDSQMKKTFRELMTRTGVALKRLVRIFRRTPAEVRKDHLVQLAAGALSGMMASQWWMEWAKSQAIQPAHGSIPTNITENAAYYARKTLAAIEEQEPNARADR